MSDESPSERLRRLKARLRDGAEAFKALPAIERALLDDEQRRSWVRGQCGRDPGPSVLATEVHALRQALARALKEREEARRERDEAREMVLAYAADSVSRADWEAVQEGYVRLSDDLNVAHAELSAAREVLKGAEGALEAGAEIVQVTAQIAFSPHAEAVAQQMEAALSALRSALVRDDPVGVA